MTKLTTLAKVGVGSLWIRSFGVDLFFTLSAYLITELLMRERQRCGAIDVRSFYIRRALRIWPLYFGALLVASAGSFLLPQLAGVRVCLPWFFLFAGNFASVGALPLAVAALWSISVEEQFYGLWPLALSRLTRRGAIRTAIALWALSLLGSWNEYVPIGQLCRGVCQTPRHTSSSRRARRSSYHGRAGPPESVECYPGGAALRRHHSVLAYNCVALS